MAIVPLDVSSYNSSLCIVSMQIRQSQHPGHGSLYSHVVPTTLPRGIVSYHLSGSSIVPYHLLGRIDTHRLIGRFGVATPDPHDQWSVIAKAITNSGF